MGLLSFDQKLRSGELRWTEEIEQSGETGHTKDNLDVPAAPQATKDHPIRHDTLESIPVDIVFLIETEPT